MAFGDSLREKHGKALVVGRTVATVLLLASVPFGFISIMFSPYAVNEFSFWLSAVLFFFVLALVWRFDRKRALIVCSVGIAVVFLLMAANYLIATSGTVRQIETADTVRVNESIEYDDYLPFESSKIARLDEPASLAFSVSDDLPKVDSATALLPLASSFVTETYPREATTVAYVQGDDPWDCTFQYNNSSKGFECLARGTTDVFFGAQPSDEQVADARMLGVEFDCTPIGREAFVFFVNGDNPVDSLTIEEARGIYSGAITNWSEVGGNDAPITAYQRNEGSGSQSQMERFMGDVPLVRAPEHLYAGSMSGVVRGIANYDNGKDAIGYSFRYYVTDLVGEYNIKLLAIEVVEPTLENIRSGSYPVTGDFYAVTRKGDTDENLARLVAWVLSDQGQLLVERSGYASVGSSPVSERPS